jgi:hypothetical protein
MALDASVGAAIVSSIIGILVVALFLHMAAKFLTVRPKYTQGLLVAVLGGVLASLVMGLVGGVLGIVLAVIVWLAVAGAIYRIGMLRALLLGVLAWLLFVGVRLLVVAIEGAIKG